ncbi:hypothetical protein CPB85DRAFT_1416528 [Mucidula mucida]|nr:hypothetical protein CPB85DRAFT_1416528 [Mucidula mucida]
MLGFRDLFPPARICLDPVCAARQSGLQQELAQSTSYKVTLFTRDLGPLPVWCHSSSCRKCHTRYYPTYYTHQHRENRTYYAPNYATGMDLVEVGMHYYVELSQAERFTNNSVCAWVSATNNAKIYNLEHLEAVKHLDDQWDYALEMSSEMALDAFFMNALLLDAAERGVLLELQQSATNQTDRMCLALEARTERLKGPGQEYWNHACDLCCEIDADTGRALRAVVTDGLDIGHVCCGVHDCQNRLESQRERFCHTHKPRELVCAVKNCEAPVEQLFKTCCNPVHRELENRGEESRTALFQLKRCLERAKSSQTNDSLAFECPDDDPVELDCPDKAETGNVAPQKSQKIQISLGRCWTHNEELCVGCCGMIFGRATFYGSEAPNAVRIFHRILFPTRRSLLGVMFYDNNCHVKKVIMSLNDHHFDGVALPVDVFHMKTKHKDSDDLVCSQECNPANFPDLYHDKKWRFNSSAAEVMNGWFGGFRSVVQEMQRDRYNFFLDEMIKRRNRMLVLELRKHHRRPYLIPRTELLQPDETYS